MEETLKEKLGNADEKKCFTFFTHKHKSLKSAILLIPIQLPIDAPYLIKTLYYTVLSPFVKSESASIYSPITVHSRKLSTRKEAKEANFVK